MAFVITQNCCADASCVPVCPVDCIRPVPDPDTPTESLYIHPESCVDCGACLRVCPVGAIYYEDDLPDTQARFRDINAQYFQGHPLEISPAIPHISHGSVEPGALRVAIVGSGPAACYAAAELARTHGIEVNVFDRLPTPYGLVRTGVAPDHQRTKDVVAVFEPALSSSAVNCYFNVEVNRDITHDEILAHHHAVIYAVGASRSRELGIPGDDLPGCHAAADVVGWYNGHPDHAADEFNLAGKRAVVIGNGNVALDVARMLVADRAALALTDIADHALERLASSAIEEVLVLARRGVADAAFSVGEFVALGRLPGVDVVIQGELGERPDSAADGAMKYDIAQEYRSAPTTSGNKRMVLRFSTRPVEVLGTAAVEGLRVCSTVAKDKTEVIETSLVLRAIGYRGSSVDGVPFDLSRGIIPNVDGRVVGPDGGPVSGVYVAGWIKRGPRGVIGTNRACAEETVARLLEDFDAGRLNRSIGSGEQLGTLLRNRGAQVVDWAGWQAIDAAERRGGAESSRPRVKFVDVEDAIGAAVG